MPPLTAQQFLDMLIAHGLDARRYSGRGMLGAECPSFVSTNPKRDMVGLLNELTATLGLDACLAIAADVRQAKRHRQTVVYFPKLRFPKA